MGDFGEKAAPRSAAKRTTMQGKDGSRLAIGERKGMLREPDRPSSVSTLAVYEITKTALLLQVANKLPANDEALMQKLVEEVEEANL